MLKGGCLVLLLLVACTKNQDLDARVGERDSSITEPATCRGICEARYGVCGGSEPSKSASCSDLCEGSPTVDQISCLRSQPCTQLFAAIAAGNSINDICPVDGSAG